MKKALEKLWNDYLIEECAKIDTNEERELTKRVVLLHENANALMNKEQVAAVEEYVDGLCELDVFFIKKAFFKGCEFSVSFLLEAGNMDK